MRITGIFLMVLALLLGVVMAIFGLRANYKWERDFESHWSLADKSSTISAKLDHLNRFVEKLRKAELEGDHNAIIFPTDDNSFDSNFAALVTLRDRLQTMTDMDTNSMAYQQAMQQVTAQEQGEAFHMLRELKQCWIKRHYKFLWDWVCVLNVLGIIVVFVFGLLVFRLE